MRLYNLGLQEYSATVVMGETENLTLFPPDVPAASPDIAAATTCVVLHDNEGPVEFSGRVIASWQQLERTTSCNYHGSTVEARQVLRYGALQLRQRAAEPITEVFVRAALRWTVLLQKLWSHSGSEKDLELLMRSWDVLI